MYLIETSTHFSDFVIVAKFVHVSNYVVFNWVNLVRIAKHKNLKSPKLLPVFNSNIKVYNYSDYNYYNSYIRITPGALQFFSPR